MPELEPKRKTIHIGETDLAIERASGRGKTAWIFPGQGISIGRLEEEFVANPLAQQIYQDAEEIFQFKKKLGTDAQGKETDVLNFTLNGSADQKKLTEFAQPMLATFYAAGLAVMREKYPQEFERYPDYVAGQSFGFVVGCYAAGVFKDHKDFFKFVKWRAEGFRLADELHPGKMAHVSCRLDANKTIPVTSKREFKEFQEELRRTTNQIPELKGLSPAIINSPYSIVYSGSDAAIDAVLRLAQTRRASIQAAIVANASGPFHNLTMEIAKFFIRKAREEIPLQEPTSYIILNTNGKATKDIPIIGREFELQTITPARWDLTNKLIANETGEAIEFGGDRGPFMQLASRASPRGVAIGVAITAFAALGVSFAAKGHFTREQRKKKKQ